MILECPTPPSVGEDVKIYQPASQVKIKAEILEKPRLSLST